MKHPSIAGILVGFLVGAIARAGAFYWFIIRSQEFLQRHAMQSQVTKIVVVSLVIGAVVGTIASLPGRPIIGAVLGAFLGAGVTVVTSFPLGCLFSLVALDLGDATPDVKDLLVPMDWPVPLPDLPAVWSRS